MTEQALNAASLWPFFRELATLAAAQTVPRFRQVNSIDNKLGDAGFDPVTVADRAAESAIRATIASRFPDHGIIGEEGGESCGSSDYTWIIDPIDGTRSFICGMPTWGTLIGLLHQGVPRFGMMSQPIVGDCFIAGDGRGELDHQGRISALRCRETTSLAHASLFSTTPEMFAAGAETDAFEALQAQVQLTRFGADCYGYALLAAGFVDLVAEADLGFYDIAPMIPLIEAAGGVVTDWSGAPIRSGGRALAAATPALHEAALAYLASAR